MPDQRDARYTAKFMQTHCHRCHGARGNDVNQPVTAPAEPLVADTDAHGQSGEAENEKNRRRRLIQDKMMSRLFVTRDWLVRFKTGRF
jgi:mono/diheme cytochrome c family protein